MRALSEIQKKNEEWAEWEQQRNQKPIHPQGIERGLKEKLDKQEFLRAFPAYRTVL